MAEATPPLFGQQGAGKKESRAIFNHNPEMAKAGASDITSQIANLNRRLRLIEERYDGLRKKIQLIEQNMLKQSKTLSQETRATSSDLIEMRRSIEDLRGKARLMVKELMDCAKADELKVLQKYIDFLEPLQYVTRTEADKLIREIVQEKIDEMIEQQEQQK